MITKSFLCAFLTAFFANAFSPSTKNPTSSSFTTHLLAATSTTSRLKRVTSLEDWSNEAEIKLGEGLSINQSPFGGLGLLSSKEVPGNSLLLTVPSDVALSIESPGVGPNERAVLDLVEDRRAMREAPWYVQFSLYLHYLDKVSSIRSSGVNMRPWLDTLPRSFDTPIHWSEAERKELQYDHLVESVSRQVTEWDKLYKEVQGVASPSLQGFTYDSFVWGCECARSRAFSGAYTGSAFNPLVYAFTLVLVGAYIGLGVGTLDQAANGAGLVFAATVFKDFVLPKLFSKKRYIICPVIDMANHNSMKKTSEVAFEFFGDAYSLATSFTIPKGDEVLISYGDRSNDQLLQYYGFVEADNPNDIYIMPPLREWNIDKLEKACGRNIAPGRLDKLERAGLLGKSTLDSDTSDDDYDTIANPKGGVVVTRSSGVDPAVIQALRALFSNEEEWDTAGGAIGNFSEEMSSENERIARLVAKTALELELDSKPTTSEEDLRLIKLMETAKSMDMSPAEELAIKFRVEKKKLILDTIKTLEA
mmetsp:Transcript_794/g.1222  ORF Transcript_794/g.1222 Transcript_794/m.1222 type:complete len:533 (-) Transcript_794:49-1647(-)